MSLLVDVMTDTLDRDYRDAAERRASTPGPPSPGGGGRPRWGAGVGLLLVLGLLTGTAAAQLRSRADELDQTREALVREVDRRTAESDELAGRVERLRAQVQGLQAAALGSDAAGQQLARRLAELELAAGVVAVSGPGLEVELDDAPPAVEQEVRARGGSPGEGRVLDRDLQDAVNGVWAAGAEAVSVNDLRLTALTAIRSAGEAVLVDFRPLSPPYVVRAVGDPEALEQRFSDGAAGRRLAGYGQRYGLRLEVRQADQLRLPAASVPELRETR